MKHEFTLSRIVKLGSAIGTNREWVTVSTPEEAVRLYRQGWEFESDFCPPEERCPVCDQVLYEISDEEEDETEDAIEEDEL
jgi:uncharacterized protein with PIN domain